MTKMPRDQWKRIVDSGFVAIVTVLAFLSFFVWRLLTSESDVKSHQTVQMGCFTSPSIRGISEKQSFLVYFQLGIISFKKKKKKKKRYWAYVAVVLIITLSILATCLVSSNCSVTHVRWGGGGAPSSDVVTSLAQCFALITFEVLNLTPPNLLGSCRTSSRWCLQNYMKNGWELKSELTSKWIYILKYSSKFYTNLINSFWSALSNFTEFTGQWP